MITFTDPKLYVKGICSAQLADPVTGDIWFSSNKFTTGNIAFSANTDPLRAGLGNPIAVIVESDPDITINFTMADFSMAAKMAAVGGSISYNAIVPVCQTVTTTGSPTPLVIDVSESVPAAPYGYSNAICYVQTVGGASLTSVGGDAYTVDPLTGTISGFSAASNTQYKVWYYTAKPTAVVGTVNSAMVGRVGMFTAQIAVYSNTGAGNQGTRVGWLYIHSLIKLLPEGANLTGDNSNYDTTVISGRAVSADESVVSAVCSDCGTSDLMYYVYAPDSGSSEITGIVVLNGMVSIPKGINRVQVQPYLIMGNDQLVPATLSNCYFDSDDLPEGTTITTGGYLTSGSVTGEGTVLLDYRVDGDNVATTLFTVQVY